VNTKNNSGQTGLHIAAMEGQEAAIKALFNMGADPDIPDEQGKKAEDVASNDTVKSLIVEQAKVARTRPPPMKGYPTTPATTPVKTKLDDTNNKPAPSPMPQPDNTPVAQVDQPPTTPRLGMGNRPPGSKDPLQKTVSSANLQAPPQNINVPKPQGTPHADPMRTSMAQLKPERPEGYHPSPPTSDVVTLLQQSLVEMQMMRAEMRDLRNKVDFLTHNSIPKQLYLRFNDKTAVFKFDSLTDAEPPHELTFR